jgi:hypothetical protein
VFFGWRSDPQTYERELTEVIDRMIMTGLRRQGSLGFNRTFEDKDDLVPIYRAYVFHILQNVNEGCSNKQLRKYIERTIELYNRRRRKASVDKNQKESRMFSAFVHDIRAPRTTIWDEVVHFNDEELNMAATALIEHQVPHEARLALGWTKPHFKRVMNQIREQYKELGYGR